jgi:hypothetical protein
MNIFKFNLIPSDMATYTQTQSSSKRPDDPLYVQHLEDLTKLGVNVDEVNSSYRISVAC